MSVGTILVKNTNFKEINTKNIQSRKIKMNANSYVSNVKKKDFS